MFNLLIDTCVWLDVAKDYRQQAILGALEELLKDRSAALILPRIVVEEFNRNKSRIVEESSRSLSATLKRAKEAVEKFGDPKRKRATIVQLNDAGHLTHAGPGAEERAGVASDLVALPPP